MEATKRHTHSAFTRRCAGRWHPQIPISPSRANQSLGQSLLCLCRCNAQDEGLQQWQTALFQARGRRLIEALYPFRRVASHTPKVTAESKHFPTLFLFCTVPRFRRQSSTQGPATQEARCEASEAAEQARGLPINAGERPGRAHPSTQEVVSRPTTHVHADARAPVHRPDPAETANDQGAAACTMLRGPHGAVCGRQRRRSQAQRGGAPGSDQGDALVPEVSLHPTAPEAARATLCSAAAREKKAAKGKRAMAALRGLCAALLKPRCRGSRSDSEVHGHGLWQPRHRLPGAVRLHAHAPLDYSHVCSQHGQGGAHYMAVDFEPRTKAALRKQARALLSIMLDSPGSYPVDESWRPALTNASDGSLELRPPTRRMVPAA